MHRQQDATLRVHLQVVERSHGQLARGGDTGLVFGDGLLGGTGLDLPFGDGLLGSAGLGLSLRNSLRPARHPRQSQGDDRS